MAEPSEGPLWTHLKSQLYKPEVKLIKRLVGHQLIQQNRLMWDEIASLRQMWAEFKEQNDQLCGGRQHADRVCDTQHRELLKRQALLLLNDLTSQATSCGHALEDMVPELRGSKIRSYLQQEDLMQNLASLPSLHMGKALDLDDMDDVAAGIREALKAEHQWLLATIDEEYQLLAEEEHRRNAMARKNEISTAELKQFLHRLQEIAVSPSLRTVALTRRAEPRDTEAPEPLSAPRLGSANVRRLQALITMRRQTGALHTVEEKSILKAETFGGTTVLGPDNQEFDPFFGDPI